MRLKTYSQAASLSTALDYLESAARLLRDGGEPALALATCAIRGKADLAHATAVVGPTTAPTEPNPVTT